MKVNYKIIIGVLLVIASIIVLVYNFSIQREIAYMASIVAVCGTSVYLIKDIIKMRKGK